MRLVQDIGKDRDRTEFACYKYKYGTKSRYVFMEEADVVLNNQDATIPEIKRRLAAADCRPTDNVINAVLCGRLVKRKRKDPKPRNGYYGNSEIWEPGTRTLRSLQAHQRPTNKTKKRVSKKPNPSYCVLRTDLESNATYVKVIEQTTLAGHDVLVLEKDI